VQHVCCADPGMPEALQHPIEVNRAVLQSCVCLGGATLSLLDGRARASSSAVGRAVGCSMPFHGPSITAA
jgi:hypothetical protein